MFGGGGQLAKSLIDSFPVSEFEVKCMVRDNNYDTLDDGATIHVNKDITAAYSVKWTIEDFKPDFIINVASLTDTNFCEANPSKAFNVNAVGAYNIAHVCNGKIPLFQISTDYVFDGRTASGYYEYANPNPINVYGISKYSGEKLTTIANPYTYIIRTSGLYSKYSQKNLASKFVSQFLSNEPVIATIDNRTFPTYCKDLALEIILMIKEKPPYGVYHLINGGFDSYGVSWYEFATEIAGILGTYTKLNNAAVTPIYFDKLKEEIKRPQFALLKSTKRAYLRDWRKALREFIDEYIELNEI